MNPYIEKLRQYLAENQPNYGDGDIHSLLEFLWWHYTECNPVTDQTIKNQFILMRPILDKLSQEDEDTMFHAVCVLCMEHERLAYLEGIRLGARLAGEMGLL